MTNGNITTGMAIIAMAIIVMDVDMAAGTATDTIVVGDMAANTVANMAANAIINHKHLNIRML